MKKNTGSRWGSCKVPHDAFVQACNETLREFPGYCTDKWGEQELTALRSKLPEKFWLTETDALRVWATNKRKSGFLDAVNGVIARKARSKPSGEYAAYLASEHWRTFRTIVLDFWGHACCACKSRERLDVHHNSYERIGGEKLTDCVVFCRRCHRKFHRIIPDGNEFFSFVPQSQMHEVHNH